MNITLPVACIVLALVFALFAAIRPQPYLPWVHPGWLAFAFYMLSFLVR